jgi:hypothetical protein
MKKIVTAPDDVWEKYIQVSCARVVQVPFSLLTGFDRLIRRQNPGARRDSHCMTRLQFWLMALLQLVKQLSGGQGFQHTTSVSIRWA